MVNSVQTIGHKLGRSETRKYSTDPEDLEVKVSLCPCTDPLVNLERLNSFDNMSAQGKKKVHDLNINYKECVD